MYGHFNTSSFLLLVSFARLQVTHKEGRCEAEREGEEDGVGTGRKRGKGLGAVGEKGRGGGTARNGEE